MKTTKYIKLNENFSKGEVFTPVELVKNILLKIPKEIFINKNSTFLVPCIKEGNFVIELVRMLVEDYGFSIENAKSRVIGIDSRLKFVNNLKIKGYQVYHRDFLNEDINMKFDVIIGNPPYSKSVGPTKKEPIWHLFVEKCFSSLNQDGYLSLIHPSGWRNVSGDFKKIQRLLLTKDIQYLEMHNTSDGIKTFGVATTYDYYIIKNTKNQNSTKIKFQDGSEGIYDISNMEFIPNSEIEFVLKLIATDEQESVDVLYSSSKYETRNAHMNKEKTNEFIYPCVGSIIGNDEPNLIYSSLNNKGHFGIPKLIIGNGVNPKCFIDYTGEYGMTQFAYGIVDTIENLEKIKKVLESAKFQKINLATKFVATAGNPLAYPRIISLFRKDFWKEFI